MTDPAKLHDLLARTVGEHELPADEVLASAIRRGRAVRTRRRIAVSALGVCVVAAGIAGIAAGASGVTAGQETFGASAGPGAVDAPMPLIRSGGTAGPMVPLPSGTILRSGPAAGPRTVPALPGRATLPPGEPLFVGDGVSVYLTATGICTVTIPAVTTPPLIPPMVMPPMLVAPTTNPATTSTPQRFIPPEAPPYPTASGDAVCQSLPADPAAGQPWVTLSVSAHADQYVYVGLYSGPVAPGRIVVAHGASRDPASILAVPGSPGWYAYVVAAPAQVRPDIPLGALTMAPTVTVYNDLGAVLATGHDQHPAVVTTTTPPANPAGTAAPPPPAQPPTPAAPPSGVPVNPADEASSGPATPAVATVPTR